LTLPLQSNPLLLGWKEEEILAEANEQGESDGELGEAA
jgi:hypothetical protein